MSIIYFLLNEMICSSPACSSRGLGVHRFSHCDLTDFNYTWFISPFWYLNCGAVLFQGVIDGTDYGHDFATKSQNVLQHQIPSSKRSSSKELGMYLFIFVSNVHMNMPYIVEGLFCLNVQINMTYSLAVKEKEEKRAPTFSLLSYSVLFLVVGTALPV